MTTKYCKDCDEVKVRVEHFYRAGTSWQRRCKPCHNAHREKNRKAKPLVNRYIPVDPAHYKIRKNGFEMLPLETKQGVLKYLDTMPLTTLAKKFDIKYNTLRSWKHRGHLIIKPQTP